MERAALGRRTPGGTDLWVSNTFVLFTHSKYFKEPESKVGGRNQNATFSKTVALSSSPIQRCDSTWSLSMPLINPCIPLLEAMWNTVEISIVSLCNRLFYNLWKGRNSKVGGSYFMQAFCLKIISVWKSYPWLETLITIKDSMRTHLRCYKQLLSRHFVSASITFGLKKEKKRKHLKKPLKPNNHSHNDLDKQTSIVQLLHQKVKDSNNNVSTLTTLSKALF